MFKKLLFSLALLVTFQSQAQFFEDFETISIPDMTTGSWAFPSGNWYISDNGVGVNQYWRSTNIAANPPFVLDYAAAYAGRENIGQGNTSEEWLVTPAIAITSDTNLDFYTRSALSGNQGTLYQIKVSTTSQTDHASFTNIAAWNEQDLNEQFNLYQQKFIPLGQYAGQTVYIAFVRSFTQPSTSLGGDSWLIDNVNVSSAPATFNNISGTTSFGPTTSDCNVFSSIPYVQISTQQGNYYSSSGGYSINTNLNDVTVNANITNPHFLITPPSFTFSFPALGNSVNADFCITPLDIYPDLKIESSTIGFRCGFESRIYINYKNIGNQMQSGSINLAFDDSKLDFTTATVAPTSQTLNNLSWDFTDLAPFETRQILVDVYVHTPTDASPANEGDVLNFTTSVSSVQGDENLANNTRNWSRAIGNSYDPNDKVVMEGETISPAQAQDFLHYLIRFQNTGNLPAVNVKVTDLLESDLDISTLEIIGGSHPFRTDVNASNLEFIFDNINLAAASVDEEHSHGYIAFKIKPKATVGIGSVIENTANIYFDYNFPITTNTATTTVTALATGEFDLANHVTLYPNPVKNVLSISVDETIAVKSISVYNMLGQLVKNLQLNNTGNVMTADVSDLDTGTYFIQIISDKGTMGKKLIKL